MRTALLLPGGGSAGIVQLGMVRALMDSGQRIDAVYATSVGCLTGAHLYMDTLDALEDLWMVIEDRDVYRSGPLELATAWGRKGLYDSTPLRNLIEDHWSPPPVPPWPFYVTATSVEQGTPVSRDVRTIPPELVPEWLLASASPPIMMPPVRTGGGLMTDGAVLSNYNVRQAVRDGADRLIVLCPKPTASAYHPRNLLDMLTFTLTVGTGYMLRHELAFVELLNQVGGKYRHIQVDLIEPREQWTLPLLSFQLGSKGERRALIQRGYRTVRDYLDGLRAS